MAENSTSGDVSWSLGQTTVDGTVVYPNGKGPYPAVVMIAGSGPTDRDWNSPLLPGSNGSARLLAGALAGSGFASFRYDKRASGPRAMENMRVLAGKLSMQSHLDELAGAIHTLIEQGKVRADRIFAIGNSEGTLHALNYQASKPTIPLAGLVLIGPPGRAVGVVARAQLAAAATAFPNGDALMALYDQAIARFLAGEPAAPDPALPEGARNLILSVASPMNQPFARELWMADSASLLPEVHVPVLCVIGKKDVQVDWQADGEPMEEATAGRDDVTFLFPQNADHVLKYEPKPRAELIGAAALEYNASDKRLDPEALAAILDWLRRHV